MRSKRWAYIAVVVGLSVGMLTLLNRESTGQQQLPGQQLPGQQPSDGRWIVMFNQLQQGQQPGPGQQQRGQQPQGNRPMVTWEYKTLEWGGGDPTPSFNDLGKQGWELVTSRGYGNENQSKTL